MIRLALLGATGRMGRRTIALLARDHRFELAAALTHPGDTRLGERIQIGSGTVTITDSVDVPFSVLMDFSVPEGTMRWLDYCERSGSAMVIGATGHNDEQLHRIRSAAADIAILKASNFSIGINLLLPLAAEIARRLDDTFDIEIIEHHHNQKVDAPSGTAMALSKVIVEATGRHPDNDVVFGRKGRTGPRRSRQIGVHAVRMGSLIGHHEIHYSGAHETITLGHTAHSRDAFAHGALHAAAWLNGRPPGMYTMEDVLSSA